MCKCSGSSTFREKNRELFSREGRFGGEKRRDIASFSLLKVVKGQCPTVRVVAALAAVDSRFVAASACCQGSVGKIRWKDGNGVGHHQSEGKSVSSQKSMA